MALLIQVITICKHVKVFHGFSKVWDFYYKAISLAIQNMGQIPLAQSIEIQNLTKSFFSIVDLVWEDGLRHGGQNKMVIETAYIPHVHVFEFLQGERRDMQTLVECNIQIFLFHQQDVKNSMTKITSNILSMI
jgi:hypothetical protein